MNFVQYRNDARSTDARKLTKFSLKEYFPIVLYYMIVICKIGCVSS